MKLSIVVACYKDAPGLPELERRVREMCTAAQTDYELIFVNDRSPGDDEEVIRVLSAANPKVWGISHARNFGSQSAFLSGLELATGDACVVMDGDLQDPPELIADFLRKRAEGFDVVYGVRSTREELFALTWARRIFYRLFSNTALVRTPLDAGDFSLLDRRVVRAMLRAAETNFFLRATRAYVGYRQTGVEYHRPSRAYGFSSNGLGANVRWMRRAFFNWSRFPLKAAFLTGLAIGIAMPWFSSALWLHLLSWWWLVGMTAILGEYVFQLLEQAKARPLYIRRDLIRDGRVSPVPETLAFPGAGA